MVAAFIQINCYLCVKALSQKSFELVYFCFHFSQWPTYLCCEFLKLSCLIVGTKRAELKYNKYNCNSRKNYLGPFAWKLFLHIIIEASKTLPSTKASWNKLKNYHETLYLTNVVPDNI